MFVLKGVCDCTEFSRIITVTVVGKQSLMTGRPYNNNVKEETIMADLLAMSADIIDGRVAPNENWAP